MSPGQAAYEEWCECLNRPKLPHIKGLRLEPWGTLTAPIRSLWDAVAKAAVDSSAKGEEFDKDDLELLQGWGVTTNDQRARALVLVGRLQRELGVLRDGKLGTTTLDRLNKLLTEKP